MRILSENSWRKYAKTSETSKVEDAVVELESTKRKRLGEVYDRYVDDVYRILYDYIGEEYYLDDIVQEVFMRYYEEMGKEEIVLVLAWLIRVGKNLLNDIYRRERRTYEGYSHISSQHMINEISAEEEALDKIMAGEIRELRKHIFDRLSREYPLWSEVLLMAYVMDMPQQEVADKLGVSLRVVHSRIFRARRWLKKHYNVEFEDVFKKY